MNTQLRDRKRTFYFKKYTCFMKDIAHPAVSVKFQFDLELCEITFFHAFSQYNIKNEQYM